MELCCLYLRRKMSRAVIAERLGGVGVSALSQNRRRLGTKMQKHSRLRKRFQRLKKVLNLDKWPIVQVWPHLLEPNYVPSASNS